MSRVGFLWDTKELLYGVVGLGQRRGALVGRSHFFHGVSRRYMIIADLKLHNYRAFYSFNKVQPHHSSEYAEALLPPNWHLYRWVCDNLVACWWKRWKCNWPGGSFDTDFLGRLAAKWATCKNTPHTFTAAFSAFHKINLVFFLLFCLFKIHEDDWETMHHHRLFCFFSDNFFQIWMVLKFSGYTVLNRTQGFLGFCWFVLFWARSPTHLCQNK